MIQTKTLTELAQVLKAEGIEVADCLDNEGKQETAYASVAFYGDDSAAIKAVQIAYRHDYQPQGLVRDWVVIGPELGESHWLMLFE